MSLMTSHGGGVKVIVYCTGPLIGNPSLELEYQLLVLDYVLLGEVGIKVIYMLYY